MWKWSDNHPPNPALCAFKNNMHFGFCLFLREQSNVKEEEEVIRDSKLLKTDFQVLKPTVLKVSFFIENSICWLLELRLSNMVILFHS